jgi:hypothetical protein
LPILFAGTWVNCSIGIPLTLNFSTHSLHRSVFGVRTPASQSTTAHLRSSARTCSTGPASTGAASAATNASRRAVTVTPRWLRAEALAWRIPAEALNHHLLSLQQGSVATTP